jgi:hypothetical protein
MTTTPGDPPPPDDQNQPPQTPGHGAPEPGQPPYGQPEQGAPGYWEQQAAQQDQPPPPGYGYGPPGPLHYAPEHPKATTALVLGILGVVVCQVLGPFAWSIGKRTVNEIDASGGQYGGRGSAQAGYILGIVGTVLLALGVLFFVFYLVLAVFLFTTNDFQDF